MKQILMLVFCVVLMVGCVGITGKTRYYAAYTEVTFTDGETIVLIDGEPIPLESLNKPVTDYTSFYVDFSAPGGVIVPAAVTSFSYTWGGTEGNKVSVGQELTMDSEMQAKMLMDMTPHLKDVIVALIAAVQGAVGATGAAAGLVPLVVPPVL